MDRERILSHGQQSVGKLLIDLQVRKSTADGEGARDYYEKLTNPLPGWDGELRDLVLAKKQVRSLRQMLNIFFRDSLKIFHYSFQPRKIFVQPNTVVVDGKVELREYSLDAAGAIQSFVERDI